jgi:hypothetical protein
MNEFLASSIQILWREEGSGYFGLGLKRESILAVKLGSTEKFSPKLWDSCPER